MESQGGGIRTKESDDTDRWNDGLDEFDRCLFLVSRQLALYALLGPSGSIDRSQTRLDREERFGSMSSSSTLARTMTLPGKPECPQRPPFPPRRCSERMLLAVPVARWAAFAVLRLGDSCPRIVFGCCVAPGSKVRSAD